MFRLLALGHKRKIGNAEGCFNGFEVRPGHSHPKDI